MSRNPRGANTRVYSFEAMMTLVAVLLAPLWIVSCQTSSMKEEAKQTSATAGKAALGMDAPPLTICGWAKGGKEDILKVKGPKVYVIEFWATWCPPCRQSIPHLTALQKKYKDKGVVVIGVSNEDYKTVAEFVKKMGDQMDYLVAVDQPAEGKELTPTFKAYMEAFGVRGIPHAFILNQEKKIIWHCHPLAGLESILDKVLAGDFDLEDAREMMNDQKAQVERMNALRELCGKYLTLIVSADSDEAQAKKAGEQLLKAGAKEPEILNNIAWVILTEEKIKKHDKDLALRMAKAALKAVKGDAPHILDTYARALCDTGQLDKAIQYQKQAVDTCKNNPEMRERLKKTLADYEAKAKTK
ncbi:MAG: redoxin family protein [Candidatus Sumerlaeota bacterium]|nr:redoxin family protein [Candidatus Sumerlaeota bacterium]